MVPQVGLQVTRSARLFAELSGSWVTCQVTSLGTGSLVRVATNWNFWFVGTAAVAGLMVTEMPESRVITQVAVALELAAAVAVMVMVGGETIVVEVGGGVLILDGAV